MPASSIPQATFNFVPAQPARNLKAAPVGGVNRDARFLDFPFLLFAERTKSIPQVRAARFAVAPGQLVQRQAGAEAGIDRGSHRYIRAKIGDVFS